jgi:hypothetical protein
MNAGVEHSGYILRTVPWGRYLPSNLRQLPGTISNAILQSSCPSLLFVTLLGLRPVLLKSILELPLGRFSSLEFIGLNFSALLSWLSSVWEFSCSTKVRNDRNNPAGESAVASHDLIEAHSRSQGCLVAHARFNDRPPPSSGNPLSGKLSGQLLSAVLKNLSLSFQTTFFSDKPDPQLANARDKQLSVSRQSSSFEFHRMMVGCT